MRLTVLRSLCLIDVKMFAPAQNVIVQALEDLQDMRATLVAQRAEERARMRTNSQDSIDENGEYSLSVKVQHFGLNSPLMGKSVTYDDEANSLPRKKESIAEIRKKKQHQQQNQQQPPSRSSSKPSSPKMNSSTGLDFDLESPPLTPYKAAVEAPVTRATGFDDESIVSFTMADTNRLEWLLTYHLALTFYNQLKYDKVEEV